MAASSPPGRRVRYDDAPRLPGFHGGHRAVAAKTVLPLAAKAEPCPGSGHGMHPDAALLAALAEFDAIEHYFLSLYRGGSRYIEDDDERTAAFQPFDEAQEPILEQVCSIQARTLEGILARARTIVLQDAELDPAADALEGYTNNRLVAALLRDLLAMGGAVA